jgi:hypothetical protein
VPPPGHAIKPSASRKLERMKMISFFMIFAP